MVGNIGTGKSTTVAKLTKGNLDKIAVLDTDGLAMMYSANDYGPHIWTAERRNLYRTSLLKLEDLALQKGFDVIVDSTAMSRECRKSFIDIAKNNGARIVVYLHRTPGGLERRCQEPRGQTRELWTIVYEGFENEFEEPSLDEGIDEIINCTRVYHNHGIKS
jgi:predicted kinase